ncbi:MAG TPA: hypothetical protein VJY62_08965, partial [Bacteroidia bacterium]|nr:hypothetical protein [Bacteroidia bacterium]
PSYSPVIVDSSGQLRSVNANDDNLDAAIYNAMSWLLGGNTLPGYASDNYLGTNNHKNLVFKTDATERMRITAAGDVGIGTSSPSQKLEIAHNDSSGGIVLNRLNSTVSKSQISFQKNGNEKWAMGINSEGWNNDPTDNFFIFQRGAVPAMRFYIDDHGRVGIGVIPPASWPQNTTHYMLYVENGIKTRDVKVTAANNFPDFVFNSTYQPPGIYELEQFIKQNKHLPGIPSAKEIEKNDGYEVGDMVEKLLEQTEIQSLYIIDLQKQIDELKVRVKNSERRK